MAFIDQGESEAMKTLSGWEAANCDEHPFRAKIKVFEPFLSYRCLTKWSEQRQKRHFRYHTLFCLTASAWLLATYMSRADHKGTQRGSARIQLMSLVYSCVAIVSCLGWRKVTACNFVIPPFGEDLL